RVKSPWNTASSLMRASRDCRSASRVTASSVLARHVRLAYRGGGRLIAGGPMFSYDPYAELATLRDFAPLELTSPDFEANGPLPQFAWSAKRGGEDRSPALQWSTPPTGTKSFAVSCFDPDAPTGSGFWHWAAYNISADTTVLPSGTGTAASLPAGSVVLPNEARLERFIGAAPPEGTGVHRYFFVVDALDV